MPRKARDFIFKQTGEWLTHDQYKRGWAEVRKKLREPIYRLLKEEGYAQNKPDREDAAADALIAYCLGHFNPDHLSDEEILESSSGTLSDESREVLKKFKPKANPLISSSTQHVEIRELAGMYRADRTIAFAMR